MYPLHGLVGDSPAPCELLQLLIGCGCVFCLQVVFERFSSCGDAFFDDELCLLEGEGVSFDGVGVVCVLEAHLFSEFLKRVLGEWPLCGMPVLPFIDPFQEFSVYYIGIWHIFFNPI